MEQDGDSSPTFWFQPPIPTRRQPPSPFFNPVALIIILPVLTLLIIFFLPPFLSHTSQILKPTSVKKSWDSLNIFLVLFAILCGVLARRNADVPSTDGDQVNRYSNTNQLASSSQWGEYSDRDRKVYDTSVKELETGGSRLKRNSSSYPDLRQQSPWETGENWFQFFDDFDVNLYSSAPASKYLQQPVRRSEMERDNVVYRSSPSLRRSEVERANVLHRSQSTESDNFHDSPRQSEARKENVIYRTPSSSRQSEVERANVIHRLQSAVSNYFGDRRRRSEAEREFSEVKEIPVDTFQVHRYLPPPSPPNCGR